MPLIGERHGSDSCIIICFRFSRPCRLVLDALWLEALRTDFWFENLNEVS